MSSQKEVNIFIEATVGEPGRGDIAIDSLRFDEGPCVLEPAEAAQPRKL